MGTPLAVGRRAARLTIVLHEPADLTLGRRVDGCAGLGLWFRLGGWFRLWGRCWGCGLLVLSELCPHRLELVLHRLCSCVVDEHVDLGIHRDSGVAGAHQ